ncbi:hypothetical protein [Pseudoprimorskyibacter insulae]|uniref:Chitin-binding type-2 domain-containing protein n=1 Tax=Pseudoprimorskyibacter insulae TaxID=1695997 RepID=A0A2R8AUQ5_9RHOB|nr:hypothetical protein [Pseudoprimorskyibacter insulae]SPF79657.1 hypothetical protein PRI8871_01454 [Pseudoprimorskyibacter insulae]
MKIFAIAALSAMSLTQFAGAAAAWENTYTPYPWDKGCDKHNCYAPYTSYMNGHYSYLKCADPAKFLTYVNGHLKCVPHKHIKK